MFENVTYTYYSSTLGRSVIPSEADFNSLKLENIAYMKTLLPYLTEREESGIDKATCLMIEEQYSAQLNKTASGEVITSFSLDGYSQNMDISKAESLYERKYKWIKLFCNVDAGVM